MIFEECESELSSSLTPTVPPPPQFYLGPMLASFHSVLLKQYMVFKSGLFRTERFLELVGGPSRLVSSHHRFKPNNSLEMQNALRLKGLEQF